MRDSRSCFSCCRSTSSTVGDRRPHRLDWPFCLSRSRLACYQHILAAWLTSSAPAPCSLLGQLEHLSLMFGCCLRTTVRSSWELSLHRLCSGFHLRCWSRH